MSISLLSFARSGRIAASSRRHLSSSSPSAWAPSGLIHPGALGTLSDASYLEAVKRGQQALTEVGFDPRALWLQHCCWGDHDQFQHANNVHYVRWLESGRMRFCEVVAEVGNFTPERTEDLLRGKGVSMILAGINVRYRKPVVYPDTLLIAHAPVLPLAPNTSRFTLKGAVYSLAQQAVVATSDEDCVVYDYVNLRKTAAPEDLQSILELLGIDEDKAAQVGSSRRRTASPAPAT